MVMQVLQNMGQVKAARRELSDKQLSSIDGPVVSFLRKLGIVPGVKVGDEIKSWDVLSTFQFIDNRFDKNDPILDIGSFCSELLTILHLSGYKNLTGIDLNPDIEKMPYSEYINYNVDNFLKTKFSNESFKVVTSISVIEHGFQQEALLEEISRLLMPGGCFVASFDYWPEKVSTEGVKFFGMDWLIFSSSEVQSFVSAAEKYGLVPAGELSYSADEKVINCGGKNYTFGWLVLEKKL